MEGASGRIEATNKKNIVRKVVYSRSSSQKKTSSLRAPAQAAMQKRMRNLTKEFKLLFVPDVYEIANTSYTMDRVDVSKPIEMMSIQEYSVFSEIQKFFQLCRSEGIYPADFELYEQPDGRVALLDFDKFATWAKDGSITFPWGQTLTAKEVSVNLAILGLEKANSK